MLSIFPHYIITVLFKTEWVVSKVVCPLKKVLKLSNLEFFSNLEGKKYLFINNVNSSLQRFIEV